MSLIEADEHQIATPTSVENDGFTDLPIDEDEVVEDVIKPDGNEIQTQSNESSSNGGSSDVTRLYSKKIEDLLVTNPEAKNTEVTILEASKSNENDHPATSRPYVIYTIKIADDIIVKRRYSEFEALRNLLVKLFPLTVIPPIPEKQSIASNFSLSGVPQTALKNLGSDSSNKSDHDSSNYIEYRKRLLTSFIKRCLANDQLRKNFLLLTFLDPHTSFNEFIHIGAVGKLNLTSAYKLSPLNPLDSLDDELYSTLPLPADHSSLTGAFKTDLNKEQMVEYTKFESRFKEYETILSSISKYNRNIVSAMNDISADYTELGASFNALSLQEASLTIVEQIGQVFDSSFFDMNLLKNLSNLKFVEKIFELRNFIKVVRNLIDYNKKKWLQSVEILRLIDKCNAILESEEKIENQSKMIDDALSKSAILNPNKSNGAPKADKPEDEESLLLEISKLGLDTSPQPLSTNKLFGYKIPGLKRVNKVILSVTDLNPEQTRKQTILKTKLKLLTLKKQYDLVTKDNQLITKTLNKEIKNFQNWFKSELNVLCVEFSKDVKQYLNKSQENWQETTK